MPTINRDGVEFNVYATVDEADVYSLGSMDSTGWDAADDDAKERALITSARLLDRQLWIDAYDTFEERETNDNIIAASIEISFILVDGSDIETNSVQSQSGGQVISSLSAGSVSISYNTSIASSTSVTARWPLPIEEKLRGLLAGTTMVASSLGGAVVYGTDGESANENIFDLARGY
jgi:hypothetical protein